MILLFPTIELEKVTSCHRKRDILSFSLYIFTPAEPRCAVPRAALPWTRFSMPGDPDLWTMKWWQRDNDALFFWIYGRRCAQRCCSNRCEFSIKAIATCCGNYYIERLFICLYSIKEILLCRSEIIERCWHAVHFIVLYLICERNWQLN